MVSFGRGKDKANPSCSGYSEFQDEEFEYKTLNCIIHTKEKLYRLGITDSPSCTFCQEEAQSSELLLFLQTIDLLMNSGNMSGLSWLKDNNRDIL